MLPHGNLLAVSRTRKLNPHRFFKLPKEFLKALLAPRNRDTPKTSAGCAMLKIRDAELLNSPQLRSLFLTRVDRRISERRRFVRQQVGDFFANDLAIVNECPTQFDGASFVRIDDGS